MSSIEIGLRDYVVSASAVEFDQNDASSVESAIRNLKNNGVAYTRDEHNPDKWNTIISIEGLRRHLKDSYSINYGPKQIGIYLASKGWRRKRVRQNRTGHLRVWQSPGR